MLFQFNLILAEGKNLINRLRKQSFLGHKKVTHYPKYSQCWAIFDSYKGTNMP